MKTIKNILSKLLIITISTLLIFNMGTLNVSAANANDFNVKFKAFEFLGDVADEDPTKDDSEPEIALGSKIERGTIFRLSTYLERPTGVSDFSKQFILNISYNPELVEVVNDSLGDPMYFPYDVITEHNKDFPEYGILPARGSTGLNANRTDYDPIEFIKNVNSNAPGVGPTMNFVQITIRNTTTSALLARDGIAGDFLFKVKEDIDDHSQIEFDLLDISTFNTPRMQSTSEKFTLTTGGAAVEENNKLAGLSAKGSVNGTQHEYLSGLFDESTTNYEFAVPSHVTSLNFGHTLEDPASGTIVSPGKVNASGGSMSGMNLTTGDNYFKTVVKTSSDQLVKEINYKVRRLSSSTDVTVTGLGSDGNTLNFGSATNVIVQSTVTDVDMIINNNGTGSESVISSNEATVNGNNVAILFDRTYTPFTIEVTPEDALAKYDNVPGIDYNRGVKKSTDYSFERASNDNSLSKVEIKNASGKEVLKSWNESLDKYEFEVSNTVTAIDIDIETTHQDASIMSNVDNLALQPGLNTFPIQVNAPDGTKKTYIFEITRTAKNNADLSSLSIKIDGIEQNPNVNNVQLTTNITMPYKTDYKLDLLGIANVAEGASVVSGNVSNAALSVGLNTYTIKVRAQDNTTEKDYTVRITVQENTNSEIEGGLNPDTPGGDDNWLVDPDNPIEAGPDNGTEKDPNDNSVDIYRYTINVLNKKTTFNMDDLSFTLPDNAILTGGNEISLNVGSNTFEFEVKSQDGSSTSRYIITVNRAKNDVASVDRITVTSNPQGSLTGNLENGFTYKVAENVMKYTVSAEVSDGSVVDQSTVGEFDLTGDTTHIVKVTSEDGSSTKEYTIKIERAKSTNAFLEEVLVSYGLVSQKNIIGDFVNQQYTLNVGNDIDSIEILAKTQHPMANFTINNTSDTQFALQYGTNTFNIRVDSETGSVSNYTLRVVRALNDNANLNELSVGGNLVAGWNQDTLEYSVDGVDEDVSTIDITYVTSDPLASVKIEGLPLVSGDNSVKVIVTAQDGTTKKTYVINVYREPSSSTDLGPGGIQPGPGNGNDTIDDNDAVDSDPYQYTVYVPFGTKTYSKDSFTVDLIHGASISYENESITLKTTGQNVFKFTITAPNGVEQQEYILNIVFLAASTPRLISASINGVDLNPFNPDEFSPTIDLTNLIDETDTQFEFEVFGPENMDITNKTKTISVTGLSEILHRVVITNNVNGLTQVYFFTFERELSSNSSLDDIVLGDGNGGPGITIPGFESDNKGPYEVEVPGDQDSIIISPDPSNPNSSIKGDGEHDLIPGDNVITIIVESEDGSEEDSYIIIVKKDIELIELELGDIVIDVTTGNRTQVSSYVDNIVYTITEPIDSTVIQAYLKAVANHNTVSITGSANKNLTLDGNDIQFILTAKDEKTKLNVTVKYTRKLNDDARLKELTLKVPGSSLEPAFNPDVFEYTVDVAHDFLTFNRDTHLSWVTQHENTLVSAPETMTLSNSSVNKYLIKTTAESGAELTYVININRGTYNSLESLSITPGQGHLEKAFSKDELNYDAMIYPGQTSFNFEWTVGPGVTVVNAASLKNIPTDSLPQSFEIQVKGDNEEIKVYTVNASMGVSTRLASMESSLGILDFKPDQTSYVVYVSLDATEVSLINVVAEDPNATISGNYTNIPLPSNESSPTVITVKNGGYETSYSVVFKKTADETGIDKIVVNDGKTMWESNLDNDGNLVITVGPDTDFDDLEFDVKLEVPGGSYEISEGVENANGDMEYTVTVKDKNGIEKDYDIVVKKDESDNNFLKELTIMGEKLPGFNRWAQDYEYKLTSKDPINVNGLPEDDRARVDYNIPQPLVTGSVIEITVTSEKGTTRVYTIKMTMDKENTATLDYLNVKEAVFSPKFNANQSQYYLTIPFELDQLTVQYLASNGGTVRIESNATVSGDVVSGFTIGSENKIDVIVEAQDGTEFTYTIHVTRSAQSENYLDSLTVKETDTEVEFALSPSFSKEHLAYTVTVPNDVNLLTFSGEFNDTLKAHGLDDVVITSFPYTHEIRVLDYQNISRIYYVTVLKEASEVVTLADLRTSEGALDPVFDANRYVYNIDVPYSVTSLELEYTTNHPDQVVTGAGVKTINTGRNEFIITVKSGNSTQTYTVFVNRANVSTPGLDWLEVSDGVLSPEFNAKVKKYHVSVDEDLEHITINAGSNSGDVIVEGSGDKTLNPGSNVFPITVDAGAGITETYYVVVNRGEIAEDNLLLAHLSITDETINEAFDPLELTYTADLTQQSYDVLDVIAIAQNPLAEVIITGNTQLVTGEHVITVRVQTADGAFQDTTITVNLGLRLLQSDIHTVGETYIATVANDQTVKDLKDQMLNENHELRVYSEGTELADDEIVGTGAIIKLVVDLVEYDSKVIVILGDVNGDGTITVADLMMTQSYVLGNDLSDVELLAADTTLDGDVTVADFMMIQAHILQQIDIHEPKEVTDNE